MSHHSSISSKGQVDVPKSSEALNRNLMELSRSLNSSETNRQENQSEQGQNDGTSPGNSSQNTESQNESSSSQLETRQNHETHEGSTQTDDASHSDLDQINANLNTSEAELQVLRVQNAQYEEKIKILTQELNIKEDVMQKTNSQMTKLVIESRQRAVPKLPFFSGGADENIEVWITQFDESLHFLNDAEKLQEMLPKFRETAADFVFGQLTYAERSDYQSLLSQLELRFKTIETPRMFQIQFDNRKQKVEESYHNFACELKRLYDKAYPRRPWHIRNEDLVRKFLNCCLNRKVAAQVEYHQSPKTIDHAVYEMVHYLEIFGQSDSNIQPTTTQSN